jgi:hypothetical protein
MTDPNFTAIAIIQDRSGSMGYIKADAEGALNQFVQDQKTIPGTATLTLAQFNDGYELVFVNKPLQEVGHISLHPAGMTAMLDAIGRTIHTLGQALEAMNEDKRPGKVLVAIVTDGLENASVEYDRNKGGYEQIANLIRHQTDTYNWEFIFLAANQDAVLSATEIGIKPENALNYDATSEGVALAGASLRQFSTSYRGTGKGSWEASETSK